MKTLISFDGDGTIWYPKSTKHNKAPHWIYETFPIVEEANTKLVLIPGIIEIFEYCKLKEIILVLLSTNPNEPILAQREVENRAKLLGVDKYFDFIISARDYPESKGEILVNFIQTHMIDASDILHIGDSYNRDYCSVQNQGIDSFLIKSDYMMEEFPFAIKHSNLLNLIKKLT